jgi:LmbE family N-acetylglucosaminyl deacetylase
MDYKLALALRIRQLRPRTVILPYWEARHPDHYMASHLAYEGCFLAGLKKLDMEGEPFRPFKILYSTSYDPDRSVRPSFVVDISAEFARRQRAILAYKSQFAPSRADRRSKVFIPLDGLVQQMEVVARYYGNTIGAKYAEPFLTREIVQIDDVVDLPVRSV